MIYKELRKQRGETIKQTASAIGISATHLGRIERYERTLTEEIEEKLKKHFGIDFKKGDKLVLIDESKLLHMKGDYQKVFTDNKDEVFTVIEAFNSLSLGVEKNNGDYAIIAPIEIAAFKKVEEPRITGNQDSKQEQQSANQDDIHNQRCTRYRKPIPKDWDYIDIYRICDLFEVDDSSGATQQAIKKLIAAGTRGYKDKLQDYKEAQFAIDERIKSVSSKLLRIKEDA